MQAVQTRLSARLLQTWVARQLAARSAAQAAVTARLTTGRRWSGLPREGAGKSRPWEAAPPVHPRLPAEPAALVALCSLLLCQLLKLPPPLLHPLQAWLPAKLLMPVPLPEPAMQTEGGRQGRPAEPHELLPLTARPPLP